MKVIEAVNYARKNHLKITIRSGGHSWACWSIQSDCLLIDLSKFHILEVDIEKKQAVASTCVTGVMLNEELNKHDLMFGGGHCPDVAIGGFLLQGGQGWGCRTWGWACEQIESMEIVMADGKVIIASRTENQDVFWAARGSGPGFFGVVISFILRLRERIGMYSSTFIFDTQECYDNVAPWYLQRCHDTSKGDLELVMLGCKSKKCLPHLEPNRLVMIIRAVAFCNSDREAKEILCNFNDGIPMIDTEHCLVKNAFEATSMASEYAQQALDNPRGHYWTQNAWLEGDAKSTANALKPAWFDLPTDQSFALHYSMGPLRPLPNDMCFDIQTEHTFSVYTIAPEDANEEIKQNCEKYINSVFKDGVDLLPIGQGGTAGIYLGDSDLYTRPIRFMSDSNWIKWKKIRQVWDPSRSFSSFHGEDLHKERWNKNPLEKLSKLQS